MARSLDTREQLLEVAERLFAERGYGATSARQITIEADANIAAVHYHFGGKPQLLQAVLTRRLEPVNRERLRRLDALERAGGAAPPDVDAILTAFLAPALRLGARADNPVARVSRLLGRIHVEAPEGIREAVLAPFEAVQRRFVEALAKTLPDVPQSEIFLRLRFAMGVMIHIVTGIQEAQSLREFEPDRAESDLLQPVVSFLTAGFSAPATRLPGGGGDAVR
ncbi:MAG: TetR/AcrR family transcriptional regulator [Myxococcota bacterium]